MRIGSPARAVVAGDGVGDSRAVRRPLYGAAREHAEIAAQEPALRGGGTREDE